LEGDPLVDEHNLKEYIMYGIHVKIQEKENQIRELSKQCDDKSRQITQLKHDITKILKFKTTL